MGNAISKANPSLVAGSAGGFGCPTSGISIPLLCQLSRDNFVSLLIASLVNVGASQECRALTSVLLGLVLLRALLLGVLLPEVLPSLSGRIAYLWNGHINAVCIAYGPALQHRHRTAHRMRAGITIIRRGRDRPFIDVIE